MDERCEEHTEVDGQSLEEVASFHGPVGREQRENEVDGGGNEKVLSVTVLVLSGQFNPPKRLHSGHRQGVSAKVATTPVEILLITNDTSLGIGVQKLAETAGIPALSENL